MCTEKLRLLSFIIINHFNRQSTKTPLNFHAATPAVVDHSVTCPFWTDHSNEQTKILSFQHDTHAWDSELWDICTHLVVHFAYLANCFIHTAKEPRKLPAAWLLIGMIRRMLELCKLGFFALLRSYHLSCIAVQTIADENSPVGRWFTNWIHTK